MNDSKVYRWTGICALATIALFFIEFPFYLVRGGGPFPGMVESYRPDLTASSATNIMICVFLDLFILGLFMVFSAGLRHLIRQADSRHEWLGTLFFGVALVYTTLTLVADSLQGATVVDALTVPGGGRCAWIRWWRCGTSEDGKGYEPSAWRRDRFWRELFHALRRLCTMRTEYGQV